MHPLILLNGDIKATGFAKPNQQIIQFDRIDLKGQIVQSDRIETVALKGKSTAALMFNDQKSGWRF